MFERFRAVLAQAQTELSHAHRTLDSAELTLKLAQAFIADMQDGFRVSASVDDDAAKQVVRIFMGKGGKVPLNLEVDPTFDTLPTKSCEFVGGSHDGKRYTLSEGQRESKTIVLTPGQVYLWDGYRFQFQSDAKDEIVLDEEA